MTSKTGFKIIEIKDGKPRFLMRGLDGSRDIPTDKWLRAERKEVSEGGPKYISGFHVLPLDLKLAGKYVAKFKILKNRVLVLVRYKKARRKLPRSMALLADQIKIEQADVKQAIPLKVLKK